MSYTIHDFLRDYPVTVTSTPLLARTDSAAENFDNSCEHFQVTLTYEDGKPMTIPFSVGSGFLRTPDAADVLNCLAMDYSTFTNSRDFEDWANDLGFDTDSRKAERMYHAVREQCSAFELLLGRELAEKLAFDVEPL